MTTATCSIETFELGGTCGGAEGAMLRVGDVVSYRDASPGPWGLSGRGALWTTVKRIWAVYERGVFAGTKLQLEVVLANTTIRIDTPSDDKRISLT